MAIRNREFYLNVSNRETFKFRCLFISIYGRNRESCLPELYEIQGFWKRMLVLLGRQKGLHYERGRVK